MSEEYDKLVNDLAAVQPCHGVAAFQRMIDILDNLPTIDTGYTRPVEFIFRMDYLAYEAVCSYTNSEGKLHHACAIAKSSSHYDLMDVARIVRCHADEEST